jgi:Tfp pilus assembly protein PilN
MLRLRAEFIEPEELLALPARPASPDVPHDNNAGSLLMCLGAVVAGLLMSSHYAKEAHRLDTQATQMATEAAEIQKLANLAPGAQTDTLRKYGVLASRGVPVAGIMDEVSRALVPGVGLSSLVINTNRSLRIEGEAKTEQAMLKFIENLRKGKGIQDLRATGYRREDLKQQSVRFAFTGRAISMLDVRVGGKR